jgi:DNA excision repair protein ERCC-3
MNDLPLIVQNDRTVLLETQHPGYEPARDRLQRFAELTKSPEYVHFYRITPVSIWNAAALGEPLDGLIDWLVANSRFPIPPAMLEQLREWYRRYGLLRLLPGSGDRLLLKCDDEEVLAALVEEPSLAELLEVEQTFGSKGGGRVSLAAANRGELKQALVRLGYPVDDRAGYCAGDALPFTLREVTGDGRAFALRDYQLAAAEAFHASGTDRGGCGVVVLPCGAGKTVVGIAAMNLLQTNTLVLTTNTIAVRQWCRELLDKTDLGADRVG